MKLVCNDYSEERKNARFKGWGVANSAPGFTVSRNNGDIVVDVLWDGPLYCVTLSGATRIIPRTEVIQTARLYLDAQRLRKKLAGAALMTIRPYNPTP